MQNIVFNTLKIPLEEEEVGGGGAMPELVVHRGTKEEGTSDE
jgi:hypothetical protein